jgi:hypothetical protein
MKLAPPVDSEPIVWTSVLLVPHDELGDTYNVAVYGRVPPLHVAPNARLCPTSSVCGADGASVGVESEE